MKKTLFILCALLLTAVGAIASTDLSSKLGNTQADWYGATNVISVNSGTAVERYNGAVGGYGTGKILYQRITGLTPGTYTVSFYAATNVARAADNSTEWPASGSDIAEAYANATTTKMTVGTESGTTGYWVDSDLVTLECTVSYDGILEFGLQNVAAGGQWYMCYAVGLTLDSEGITLSEGDVIHECVAGGSITDWGTVPDWTMTQTGGSTGTFHVNYHSTEADPSGMVVPFAEYWVAAGSNLSDATIKHYQLTELPAGYYDVSIDVRAFNESGATAINEGATVFTVNGTSVDITTLTSTTAFSGHYELYGTLEVLAQVTAGSGGTGTLDAQFTVASANYNWLAFKTLNVKYLGETLTYSIGEPECALDGKYVQPGSTVSITFYDTTAPSGEPSLDGKISVNETDVETTLSYSGTTATVTFTVPSTIGYGETVEVVVPAGLLSWDGQEVSSTAKTFTLYTPIMADQDGVYILSVYDNEFLSRGYNYGTAADVDRYGVPVNIVFGDDGKATVEYMDSKLYLYGPNWAWSDAAAADASHYTIVAVAGETGVYQFLGGTGSDDAPMYVYDVEKAYNATDTQDTYRVANNGIKNPATAYNYTDDEQTYWKILTRTERDAIKDAWVLGEYQEIAASFGATISSKDDFETFLAALGDGNDATSSVTDATLTSVTLQTDETTAGWRIKYPSENSADPSHEGFASDTNCTQMFQSDGDLYQNVEDLDPGLYKVTLKGFIRHGWYDTCVEYQDYDLSYAYLRANDYEINLVPWVKDATLGSATDYSDSTPKDMDTAGTAFDSTNPSKYDNTLYTIVGDDGKLSIEIACPGWLSSEWTCIRDLTLTYYGNPVTWEMTEAGWGTLILPFGATLPDGLTAYSTGEVTPDDEDSDYTLSLNEAAADSDGKITLKANTPYIMAGTEGTYTFTGTPEEATSGLTSGKLTGTYETMDYTALMTAAGSNTVYLLQNHDNVVAFYPVVEYESSAATLTPYHCYLTLSDSDFLSATGAPAKLSFSFGGEATGIVAVEGAEAEGNGAIYDLSGRKVSKAVKGVYIQNGKKVLVK